MRFSLKYRRIIFGYFPFRKPGLCFYVLKPGFDEPVIC